MNLNVKKLNVHQAVEYLESQHGINTTKSTLDTYRCRGVGPNYMKLGSRVYYTADLLDDWVKKSLVVVHTHYL